MRQASEGYPSADHGPTGGIIREALKYTERMSLPRRTFLATSGAAAAGFCLSLAGCSKRSSTLPAASSWRDAVAKIEERLPVLMSELKVPGAAIAAIKEARVVWIKNCGVSSADTGAPVNSGTLFEAQSMSKPVFAYRVMKLQEQGVLNLDVPLTRYTPYVFVKNDPRLELVTARRVLSHTTGLPNWRSKEEPLRFEFTPGERWKYSGEGYHYLQSVVSRLTGHVNTGMCETFEEGYRVCATDFGEYMAVNVLRPFDMTSSTYLWSETVSKHKATAHDQNGRPVARAHNTPTNVARYGAAGSLLTTAADYAKFLIEVMAPKPPDDYRLKAASLTEMLRPQVDVPGPVKMSWGLGWQIWHIDKGTLIAHGGDDTGFHSESMFSPLTRSGFVMLTNGDNGAGLIMERLLTDLINLCFAN